MATKSVLQVRMLVQMIANKKARLKINRIFKKT